MNSRQILETFTARDRAGNQYVITAYLEKISGYNGEIESFDYRLENGWLVIEVEENIFKIAHNQKKLFRNPQT